MDIKEIVKSKIKRSLVYYRYHCARTYQREKIKQGKAVSFYGALLSVKCAYYSEKKEKYPLQRIEKILQNSRLNENGSSIFLYSIDDRSQCVYKEKIIDNMPIDYALIVKGSLEDLRKKAVSGKNKIGEQNDAMIQILERYIDSVCAQIKNQRVIDALLGIKSKPAVDLFDALQRILFINQVLWQTGHKLNGLGRLDRILDNYPVDPESENFIEEFLNVLHLYYPFKSNTLRGDTGQLIILGGIEDNGEYFYNEYTSLFMKCLKKLQLPDPKLMLRVSTKTPRFLLEQASECILSGLGCPLLSNDDVIVPALLDFNYEKKDAVNYGVSACWEPLAIGCSLEQNNLLNIEFAKVLDETLHSEESDEINDYSAFFNLYLEYLREHIRSLLKKLDDIKWEPDPLITLFTEGCLESGRDISNGGAKYCDYGLLSVGMASTVNALSNIERFVYKERTLSKKELVTILDNDFEDHLEYKQLFQLSGNKYGTPADDVIAITQGIMDCVTEQLRTYHNIFGGKTKFGLSSPDYINMGKNSNATADGRNKGSAFSTHISCDGNNAMLDIPQFVSALKICGYSSNGNVIDVVLQPAIAKDKERFVDYLFGCIRNGVFQAQYNVLSYDQLIDAKIHPERYPNLIVRVWGFSAYFNDLPDEYKDVIIGRAKRAEGR